VHSMRVVSSVDQSMSDGWAIVNIDCRVHGRNQVLFTGIRFCWFHFQYGVIIVQ
jgi:hypothetical protein